MHVGCMQWFMQVNTGKQWCMQAFSLFTPVYTSSLMFATFIKGSFNIRS